ncbi:hypothetical protein AB4K20DRAFT_1871560 [Rhizopus microsporus]|uniref:Uncharacterized protein n=1 Tax=Rhizopus microsporus TaxID=58291 RepID=A0A1X0RSF1_RHIZD|nr:hypothetical protein BCV71DRAFT_238098 [Rhizopus microsporus]
MRIVASYVTLQLSNELIPFAEYIILIFKYFNALANLLFFICQRKLLDGIEFSCKDKIGRVMMEFSSNCLKDEIINTNMHFGRHLDGDVYLLYNTSETNQLCKSTNRMGIGKMVLYGEMVCSCIKEPRRSLRLASFDGIVDEVKE